MDAHWLSYSVWITGFLEDTDIEDCRRRVASLFGIECEQVDELFRRMPCELKGNLKHAAAHRYEAVFTLVGLRAEVRSKEVMADISGDVLTRAGPLSIPADEAALLEAMIDSEPKSTSAPEPAPARRAVSSATWSQTVQAVRGALQPAGRFVLPAVLTVGAVVGAAALLVGTPLSVDASSASVTSARSQPKSAASLTRALDAEEQKVLASARTAGAAAGAHAGTPLFPGIHVQVSRDASGEPACSLALSATDGDGQPAPAWWSLAVQGHGDAARLVVARYFLHEEAPTLVIDDRRVRMEGSPTPQTALVSLNGDAMRDFLRSRQVQVHYGKEAGKDIRFSYDVSRLASAWRVARELCRPATAEAVASR